MVCNGVFWVMVSNIYFFFNFESLSTHCTQLRSLRSYSKNLDVVEDLEKECKRPAWTIHGNIIQLTPKIIHLYYKQQYVLDVNVDITSHIDLNRYTLIAIIE